MYSSDEKTFYAIPRDIVEEVFSKLSLDDLLNLSAVSKDFQQVIEAILKYNACYNNLKCALILNKIVDKQIKANEHYWFNTVGIITLAAFPSLFLGTIIGCLSGLLISLKTDHLMWAMIISTVIVSNLFWLFFSNLWLKNLPKPQICSWTENNIHQLKQMVRIMIDSNQLIHADETSKPVLFANIISIMDFELLNKKDFIKALHKIKNDDYKRTIFNACLDKETTLGQYFLQEQGFFGKQTNLEAKKEITAYLRSSKDNWF